MSLDSRGHQLQPGRCLAIDDVGEKSEAAGTTRFVPSPAGNALEGVGPKHPTLKGTAERPFLLSLCLCGELPGLSHFGGFPRVGGQEGDKPTKPNFVVFRWARLYNFS